MDDLILRAAAVDYLMTNMGWHDEDGYEVDDADEKRAIIVQKLPNTKGCFGFIPKEPKEG